MKIFMNDAKAATNENRDCALLAAVHDEDDCPGDQGGKDEAAQDAKDKPQNQRCVAPAAAAAAAVGPWQEHSSLYVEAFGLECVSRKLD